MEALPLLLLNLFLRRQQKAKQEQSETALPVARHRESVKILKAGVYMQAATEVSPQPPTEKKTDFCTDVAVYSTAYVCGEKITENSCFLSFFLYI